LVFLQKYITGYLAHYIHSLWFLRLPQNAAAHEERIIPDGHLEMVIHLHRDKAKRLQQNACWQAEPQHLFLGQNTKSYYLKLEPGAELYGIRFRPEALPIFYDIAAHHLTDTIVSLDIIPGAKEIIRLADQDTDVTFESLTTYFSALLNKSNPANPKFLLARYAINKINRSLGQIKIDSLSSEMNISTKYLEEVFRFHVGITPKIYSTLVQLQYFIRYRNHHPLKTLTECSYEAGFYDQAHLIRTFTRYTEMNPHQYFKNPNQINNYFI